MKNILLVSLIFLLGASLSSCLKDERITNREYGMEGLEDIRLVELSEAPSNVISLVASDADTTFALVGVHLNSAEPAQQDITVTLIPDTTVINDYNDANGTGYEVPPSGDFSLSSLTVTIPKGSRDGYLDITTKPSNLAGGEYAFGYTIGSVSDASIVPSKNYKSLITIVGVKNKYDGHYSASGTMVDYSNAELTGYYPLEWDLVTNGSNQVVVYDRDYTGSPAHIIATATGLSLYGSFGLVVTFDLTTDAIISVTNVYGQPAGNGRYAELDPSGINMYDPSTGSIDIKYWMNQDAVITPHRVSFDEHWEYIGPR